MAWRPDSSVSYNNKGPGPSFIAETQCMSKQALLYLKEYFPGVCYTCGAMPSVTGIQVLWCAGCELVAYCNKNCQRENWKAHKTVCKKFPVKMGKNIIVRKTESVRLDLESFHLAMNEISESVTKSEDDSLKFYTAAVENIIQNVRVCFVCREARKEKLFDCRCCSVSYCSESHRMMDTLHSRKECDILYGRAMANWYLTKHLQLEIPFRLMEKVNLTNGLNFENVSKVPEYSSKFWLEAIVHLINERLTFPLTILHALKNIKLGEQRKCLYEITSLTIHIIHGTPMLDPRMWEFMLHQLPNLKILNLTFINWNMELNTPYNLYLPLERCFGCRYKQKVINYNIQPIHYHEYFSSDDYVQPDVVAVFDTEYGLKMGQMLHGENIEKVERFTYQGNITYSKHTVVILTDYSKDPLEACVKSFNDARPVKVLLPVQENPSARYTIERSDNMYVNAHNYMCCIRRHH